MPRAVREALWGEALQAAENRDEQPGTPTAGAGVPVGALMSAPHTPVFGRHQVFSE